MRKLWQTVGLILTGITVLAAGLAATAPVAEMWLPLGITLAAQAGAILAFLRSSPANSGPDSA